MSHPTKTTYRVTKQFPRQLGEQLTIRNGNGKAVERWTLVNIDEGKGHDWLTYAQQQMAGA